MGSGVDVYLCYFGCWAHVGNEFAFSSRFMIASADEEVAGAEWTSRLTWRCHTSPVSLCPDAHTPHVYEAYN